MFTLISVWPGPTGAASMPKSGSYSICRPQIEDSIFVPFISSLGITVSTLFGRVVDGSTGVTVTVPAGLPVPAVALAVVLFIPVAGLLVPAEAALSTALPVPAEAALSTALPVPAKAALVLMVLPVPAVFSEAVAVLPVPSVLSEVFVLIVVLLFPTSSALLTIGVASSVPLMTSVTSFRDIFFFFMRSPLYLLLHAFFMR